MYAVTDIQELISHYNDKGGDAYTIEEGVLGLGKMILFGKGLKTIIVNEVYLNEWSCTHKIRMYNKMPEKYSNILELAQ